MGIKTWLMYKKIQLIGDREFEKKGKKELPCERCGTKFISYMHYGEWSYIFDSLCNDCKNSSGLREMT